MKVAVFSTKDYDRQSLDRANARYGHVLVYLQTRLTSATASLAEGCQGVCAFVNDQLDADTLRRLHAQGTRVVALRAAGFNNVHLEEAERLGLVVARVPGYSPHSVAEHALTLILALNRKIYRAYNRVREGNFALDGLLGFDLYGKNVGVIGTGRIGTAFARIMRGLGCRILAYDPSPSNEVARIAEYVPLQRLYRQSDIISLHCPLTPQTHHLIDAGALEQMRSGVMLINTSRGYVVDTRAVIRGLKSGKIGYLGLDVYEEEADLFFDDLSERVIQDDVFTRLLTFPNVVITAHQAFFTREALHSIADTTLANITAAETGRGTLHRVTSALRA